MCVNVLRSAILAWLFGIAPSLEGQPASARDSAILIAALRVTALDERRQGPRATPEVVDSLLDLYTDSILYEHPGVGARIRGKPALRAGMLSYLRSRPDAPAPQPRIAVGAGVAVIELPGVPHPRAPTEPVSPLRRSIRVLEFDERGLVRRIIDYPW